jgi:Flp pilus assembly protein TadD
MQTVDQALARGAELLARGEYQQAANWFDGIVRAHPQCAEAISGAAIAFSQMGQVGVSISLFNASLMLSPEQPVLWANLGMSLRRAGHTEWARQAYHKALGLNPKEILAMTGLAGSHVNEGDPEPGVVWARRAVAIDPDMVVNSHNLALCLMELARWQEAWPHWRKRVLPRHEARKYPGERWRGEVVDTLVVHGEQGLGDEVMFLGCLPQFMGRMANLVIEVNPRLVPIVAASFPQATVIGSQSDYTPREGGTHAWVPLGDLPELCHKSRPPKLSGYLKAPSRDRSDRVLLAVRGGTMETHDYLRNPPLEAWEPVLGAIRARGLRPVSIQYGPQGAEIAAKLGVEHDAAAAGDITEQAAAIWASRGLVSVQQTALHLAGALGVPVWGVISNKPAWRYGLKGPMPWYQSVDLYRQGKDEKDWGPVMARVAAAIGSVERERAA